MGRVDHRAATEPHGVQIQAADIGLQLHHVFGTDFRGGELGARRRPCRFVVAWQIAPAGPRGQVDQHIGIARANQPDDLTVVLEGHARLAGGRIAHVNVTDGGTLPGGADAGLGDLGGGYRQRRVVLTSRKGAGDGTADDGRFHECYV